MKTYTLRPQQEDAIRDVAQSFRTGHKRPILQAATGFGKTLTAIDIIHRALAKGKRVLFVVDRITLIDQTSAEFDKHGLDHGVIQGQHWRTNSMMQLQLGSAQTIPRRYRTQENHFDLIIVDECHAVYKSFVEMLTEGQWKDVPVIGLSATPWTKNLGKIYDDLVLSKSTGWLIENGYLSEYEAYGGVKPDLKGVKTTAGDFNQKELSKRVNRPSIIGDIVETYKKYGHCEGKYLKAVCFAVDVAHSKSIVEQFLLSGISAAHIDAHTPEEERLAILHSHDIGDTKILCNVGITTKGWDSPDTLCLIYARPTKSEMLHVQIMGRVLRVATCGSKALILDHGGNIERLGFPDSRFSEHLCQGDVNLEKQKKKEREEPLPKPCPSCTYMFVGQKCPVCGFERKPQNGVEVKDGEFKKLDKVDMSEKLEWFGMMLGYVRSKGWKDGSASHMYRQKFGVWPAKKQGVAAITPNEEVLKYIKYLNIKRAKTPYNRRRSNA
jgi:superfamily II DNA or RNA helicase